MKKLFCFILTTLLLISVCFTGAGCKAAFNRTGFFKSKILKSEGVAGLERPNYTLSFSSWTSTHGMIEKAEKEPVYKEKFAKLGVAADEVIIKNLKLPEEVEQAMDKRTTLGIMGDKMSAYAQYESVAAMRDAAKNPGAAGMFAGMGVGLGAGSTIGAGFAQNLNAAMTAQPAEKIVQCAKCGAKMSANAKFCPNCGEKNNAGATAVCGNCKANIPEGSKFCPECGTPTKTVCPGCKAEIKGSAKFCPECGYKVK